MFKDYIKLNKLAVFLISVLLILFIAGQVLYLVLVKVDLVTRFFNLGVFSGLIPNVYALSSIIVLGLLAITLFVTAVKMVMGKSRELIMMHRGRSYYLKLQLTSIITSALIICASTVVFQVVERMTRYALNYDLNQYPPFAVASVNFNPTYIILSIFGLIGLYYLVVYIIDIFANSSYRYKNIVTRNLAVFLFLFRVVMIFILSIKLAVVVNSLHLDYNTSYTFILAEPYAMKFSPLVIVAVVVLVSALIIDYMVYFKKKVLV